MTGYIEIELGGELRQVKFGNLALMLLQDLSDKDDTIKLASENTGLGTLPFVAALIYSGIICQDTIKQRPHSVTMPQVLEWVYDDFDLSLIAPIMECFNNSKAVGRMGKQIEEARQVHKNKLPAAAKKK